MPSRAPRICECGARVPAGIQCACQVQRTHERKARAEANRPSANARGYGTKWQEARLVFLKANRTCVRCQAPATVVHHKVPHRGDLKLFWRRSNWEAACAPCHNGPIQAEEKRT